MDLKEIKKILSELPFLCGIKNYWETGDKIRIKNIDKQDLALKFWELNLEFWFIIETEEMQLIDKFESKLGESDILGDILKRKGKNIKYAVIDNRPFPYDYRDLTVLRLPKFKSFEDQITEMQP